MKQSEKETAFGDNLSVEDEGGSMGECGSAITVNTEQAAACMYIVPPSPALWSHSPRTLALTTLEQRQARDRTTKQGDETTTQRRNDPAEMVVQGAHEGRTGQRADTDAKHGHPQSQTYIVEIIAETDDRRRGEHDARSGQRTVYGGYDTCSGVGGGEQQGEA